MTAACGMVDIVLRLRIGVKDVSGNNFRDDEFRQIVQQRLIARSDHGVAGVRETTYRPKYTAVICSRPWPISRLITSRAWRSISFCFGVSWFDRVPSRAGHAQPVNS
jgi:hypothetical protein